MTLATADFDYIRSLVHERAAIALEPSKAYLVETRLAPVVRAQGMTSIADLVTRLKRTPRAAGSGLHDAVIEAMTTNETSWYRDVHPFHALERRVLPELVERRAAQRALTIWSAACSSGQEPYTVAFLLRDRFPQLAAWNVRIIATDISAEMIGRAAAGTYSQLEVGRGLPAPMLVRHFERRGTRWQVRDDVRAMVEFRTLNLAKPWPFVPPVDLLLLRNVLIYFDLPTKRAVLERVRSVLRSDGYLMLGGSETTLGVDDRFERVQIDRTACYRPR